MGGIAEARRHLEEAEEWHRKSLMISAQLAEETEEEFIREGLFIVSYKQKAVEKKLREQENAESKVNESTLKSILRAFFQGTAKNRGTVIKQGPWNYSTKERRVS